MRQAKEIQLMTKGTRLFLFQNDNTGAEKDAYSLMSCFFDFQDRDYRVVIGKRDQMPPLP